MAASVGARALIFEQPSCRRRWRSRHDPRSMVPDPSPAHSGLRPSAQRAAPLGPTPSRGYEAQGVDQLRVHGADVADEPVNREALRDAPVGLTTRPWQGVHDYGPSASNQDRGRAGGACPPSQCGCERCPAAGVESRARDSPASACVCPAPGDRLMCRRRLNTGPPTPVENLAPVTFGAASGSRSTPYMRIPRLPEKPSSSRTASIRCGWVGATRQLTSSGRPRPLARPMRARAVLPRGLGRFALPSTSISRS
jgi:hypothetical protein